ncbi:MAG: CPBP family intramembrane metalloprotease [Gemmatimonadetes bacterium]|nr:CPBP family intramembrane metalloprotease [Gemmatimonadota bacterium]
MAGFSEQVDEALLVIGRLVVVAGASLLALLLLGVVLKPLLPGGLPPGREGRTIFMILLTSSLAVGHLVAGALLERGQWDPTGLGSRAWRPLSLFAGPALGMLAIAAPTVLLIATGVTQLVPAPGADWSSFASESLLVVALMALVQELGLRGYAIGLIAERWGDTAAIAVTSLAAVLLTLREPSASVPTFVGVAALAICLGAIRLHTGSLVASWLAHVAFAWTQVGILHAPRAGVVLPSPPQYLLEGGAPHWLSGGANGPGAGAAVAAGLAVVTFLVLRARPANAGQARD